MGVIIHGGSVRAAEWMPPVSKSDAHRAAVLADITRVPVAWADADDDLPGDVRVIRAGLASLAATHPPVIDCVDGGAPFRFLLAQAAFSPGLEVAFAGSDRLGERPHEALAEALVAALEGVSITRGTPWPWRVVGGVPRSGTVEVDASGSGQFLSAVLLGAARHVFTSGTALTVRARGPVASRGYVDMTLRWMRSFGFHVVEEEGWTVARGPLPVRAPEIPRDWSSTAYLLLMAWKTGGRVLGMPTDDVHPDGRIVALLRGVGLSVDDGRVSGKPTGSLDVDARECPDLVPTLAAFASLLPVTSVFRHVGVLRTKESDRVQGVLELAQAVGSDASVGGDELRVGPSKGFPPRITVDAAGDHRRAMCGVLAGVLARCDVELGGETRIEKSFPSFLVQVRAAGG